MNSLPHPHAKLVTITPAVASELLKRNEGNRPVRKRFIKYLADQIANDQWQVTTDAIGIRTDGRVANGQHRLAAIVEADRPAPLYVVEGVTEESFRVLDTGMKRSAGDALQIDHRLAADATLIGHILGRSFGRRVTVDVVANIAQWWQPVYDRLLGTVSVNAKAISNSSIRVGAGLQLCRYVDPALQEYVLQQFTALVRGDMTGLSKSVGWLWKRQMQKGSFYGSVPERIALTSIAYHVFAPERRDLAPHVLQSVVSKQVKDELLNCEAAAGMTPVEKKRPQARLPRRRATQAAAAASP